MVKGIAKRHRGRRAYCQQGFKVTNYRHMVLTKGDCAVSALPKAFLWSLKMSLSCLVSVIHLWINSLKVLVAVWVVEPVLMNTWSCESSLALKPSMCNRFTQFNLNCLVRVGSRLVCSLIHLFMSILLLTVCLQFSCWHPEQTWNTHTSFLFLWWTMLRHI